MLLGLEYGQHLQKHLDGQRSSTFRTSRNCVKDNNGFYQQGMPIKLDITERSANQNRNSKKSMDEINTEKLPKANVITLIPPSSKLSNFHTLDGTNKADYVGDSIKGNSYTQLHITMKVNVSQFDKEVANDHSPTNLTRRQTIYMESQTGLN